MSHDTGRHRDPRLESFDPQPPESSAAQSSPSATPRNDPYVAWRSGDFRRFVASWYLMIFAKMVETVAVQVYVYHRTHNALNLGLIGLIQAMPVLVLAIPGGQIADRWNRRWVLVATLSTGTLVSFGLTLAAYRHVPVEWIYVLLGMGAVAQALGSPSRAAVLPQIVDRKIFANAVTWNTTVFHLAAMTGPAIGGLIVEMSIPSAFALAAGCRLVSTAAVFGLRIGASPGSSDPISLESLMAGIRFVWKMRLILAVITLDLFAVLLGGAAYLLPMFCEDILKVGPQGLGFLRSAEAVGAVSMGVLLAFAPPMRSAGRTLLLAVAGFGAATIGLGLSRYFLLSLVMMFLIGALDNVSVVVRHTIVQMLTPDVMRGRVSAINNIFIVASNDLGGLESGLTAWLFGPVISVVGGGIGAIMVVLGVRWIWPEIRAVGSLADIRPAEIAPAEQQADEELAQRG